jgi:isopentenyl-diphosphate delta-isomerase
MTGPSQAPRQGLQRAGDTSADAVILVGAEDNETGTMPKLDAHRQGVLHRAVSVLVRDSRGRLLLQQRALSKYHSGGLWTNTCCGHPRPGEAAAEAASRRLLEEMGFSCPLTFLLSMQYRAPVSNGLTEHELVHVFGGRFDGAPRPNPDEVMGWRWGDPAGIARDLEERPEIFTVWFRQYCREHWDVLLAG